MDIINKVHKRISAAGRKHLLSTFPLSHNKVIPIVWSVFMVTLLKNGALDRGSELLEIQGLTILIQGLVLPILIDLG